MKFLSAFDIIGPNMVGPSSSHTAGAAKLGLLARKMFSGKIKVVSFTLYGSFAKTYRGHGTDRALLGGVLGFAPDDVRIRDAFSQARQQGIEYEFIIDEKEIPEHPNTADIRLQGIDGSTLSIRGESTGGGRVQITRINGVKVEFTGEYGTIIVRQIDKPGVVRHIVECVGNYNINIAFMKVFREEKGGYAYIVMEVDGEIPQELIEEARLNENIEEVLVIQ